MELATGKIASKKVENKWVRTKAITEDELKDALRDCTTAVWIDDHTMVSLGSILERELVEKIFGGEG